MATLTLRTLTNSGDTTKGSRLTAAEVDQNFINLDNELGTKAPISQPTFKNSGALGTDVSVVPPNGVTYASIATFGVDDVLNSTKIEMYADSGTTNIVSGKTGTATAAPLNFIVGIGLTACSFEADGNINIPTWGAKIKANFSHATVTNRVMFQTNSANSTTVVGALPSGTGTTAAFNAYNASDPTNASVADFRVAGTTDVRFSSTVTGTGTFLPMTFYTSGSERMRIDTSGRLGINVTPAANTILDVNGTHAANIVSLSDGNINCAAGNYFVHAGIGGNITFAFNTPPASRAYAFTLEATHNSGTITWPASVQWPNGIAPTLTTGKTHLFVFVTDDGGTRWRGASQVNYTN